jgi:hypothetical protein
VHQHQLKTCVRVIRPKIKRGFTVRAAGTSEAMPFALPPGVRAEVLDLCIASLGDRGGFTRSFLNMRSRKVFIEDPVRFAAWILGPAA